MIFCVNERGIKAYNNIGRNQNEQKESEGIKRDVYAYHKFASSGGSSNGCLLKLHRRSGELAIREGVSNSTSGGSVSGNT